MKTAYILKAHVETDGTVKVDEKAPLPPGPIDVLVQPRSSDKTLRTAAGGRRKKWLKVLREIDAIKCPPVPDDGKSIDELVYGYKAPRRNGHRGK